MVDIDLTFDPAQQSWSGTFSRGGTAKQVRLQRPGASAQASTRLVGDWFLHLDHSRGLPFSATCIHVAEGVDGTLIVWEDSKSPRIINGPMHNDYGREYDVGDGKFDSLALRLAASRWGGNQTTFSGTLSPDGAQMQGCWATNGQPSDSLVFIKSSGEGFTPPSPKQENSQINRMSMNLLQHKSWPDALAAAILVAVVFSAVSFPQPQQDNSVKQKRKKSAKEPLGGHIRVTFAFTKTSSV